ncbi:hypothetical protein GCM10007205_18890 [Oxalicibacterium flavum]|uniref:Uncharacterized protein n=1 Tax=Oxalicibacterium flavum TaxID=179467 RepID=A0A8J2UP14_9BURK|nr:hypothetical protein [Oxalicibacterium flavum]GGC10013.1 hypothetical protein GCM10007205_18890 [Oxalicibacterium flavum]
MFGSVFILLALAVSYLCAPLLPVTAGWENGWIENLQALLLFAGGVWAFWFAARLPSPREKAFWHAIAPLWLILGFRELSWGAVFHAPVSFSHETGPMFSSSMQLWYKPAVTPVLALVLLVCVWIFVRGGHLRTLGALWRQHSIPLREMALVVICMFVSAAAEGHMGLSLNLSEGTSQVFEELAELCAYSALLLAQARVMRGFRQGGFSPVIGS